MGEGIASAREKYYDVSQHVVLKAWTLQFPVFLRFLQLLRAVSDNLSE
jgi:hypothetical protein